MPAERERLTDGQIVRVLLPLFMFGVFIVASLTADRSEPAAVVVLYAPLAFMTLIAVYLGRLR